MAPGGYPRRFGSYVLLKPLARGGMGELDLAVTGGRGMEKLCVIKRVLPHLLAADNVQRFREEAMMVVRLSHGNLVGVLDAGREEGQFYLAMDFVEGKDLLATWNQCATRRVAFPIPIAAYVVKELARGLGYAHGYRDLHLVHRDISPANVLLSYSGEVKLTDFGLATSKLKEQRTAPGIIYGKLAYLTPEQAGGRPLDGRTDLYAAGILLWEMLTGQQLFPTKLPGARDPSGGHNSTLDALERVKNPSVKQPSLLTGRVPPELDTIVMRALRKNPDERYQTGEAFRLDLAAFLAKEAPETDAATLASFMSLLWEEQIDRERTDRDALMRAASVLLSGNTASVAIAGGNDAAGESAAPPPAQSVAAPSSAEWPDSRATPDLRGVVAPALRRDARVAADRVDDPDAPTGALPRPPRERMVVRDPRDRRMGNHLAGQLDDRPARPEHAPPPGVVAERIARPIDALRAGFDADGGLGKPAGFLADRPEDHPPDDLDLRVADEDPRVGSTIAGRYFLRRLCGEGAMGRVYDGHHIEIGRRVAIKILHSNFRNTADVVERFRREARAASKIGHPNIVDVTDSGTTPDGAFFFVMEYLDGVDLEQLIAREGRLPIERALLIAAQVCRALVGAHTAGIIHRDLKPANVMLIRHRDEEDFVKVLDFGISKQSELDIDPRGKHVGLTRPDAAVGTPIYMAPEQVAGHPADGRTDVYAVGELLFEMLTGVAACAGSDVIAVFNKKANEDPAPARSLRPDLPVEIEHMLTRAMSRRPADRHDTMAVLKDEIMGCLGRIEAAPVPAGSPNRTEVGMTNTSRVWRPASRAIWLTGAGVIAGLGMAAAVVLWRTDMSAPGPRGAPVEARPDSLATKTSMKTSTKNSMTTSAKTSSKSQPTTPAPNPTTAPAAAPASTPAATLASALPSATASPIAPAKPPAPTPIPAAHRSAEPAPAKPTSVAATARRSPPASPSPSSSPASSLDRGASPTRSRLDAPNRSPITASPTSPAPPTPGAAATDALTRGRAAFAKGNFPEAVRLGRTVVAAGDTLGGRLLLADAFYKMERYVEAVAEYEAALRFAPGHALARRGRELALRHSPR